MNKSIVWSGKPYPLGATCDKDGVNFAIFSAHAEKIELCLFDDSGEHEIERIVLSENTDKIWHIYLPNKSAGLLYAYRVYGVYEPENGHRFNHHKLLLDPYAKQIYGDIKWHNSHYSYIVDDEKEDLSFDTRDNASLMPKCVIIDDNYISHNRHPLNIPWNKTIIYETHVRGFTITYDGIDELQRGKFLGMANKEIIAYLKALGITSVELMPIQAFADEPFLTEKNLKNYWGYNSFGFFAPANRYMSKMQNIHEFKFMVNKLHEAGIEVILDVVFNHTAEGGHNGPTLNFRGIDNLSYYKLLPENKRYYINDSGCGNTLNIENPRVLQMIMDSLRYWVTKMHVDGFRFDLATILGRDTNGFNANSFFFHTIYQDPILSKVKLIAEPWDIGIGGYQLGAFPAGWAEWNDRYRDTMRRFWRGDENMLPEFAKRLHGSSDLFEHNGRQPYASINFITSHDGFTLNDLVSYNERHNHINNEENRDGQSENFSSNYGIEGLTDEQKIIEIRFRQRKNLLASLFLVQGTPMLLAGDEFGRSQNGNNNAYCQDNKINWMNWSEISDSEQEFLEFVKKLIKLRKEHPLLRRPKFLHGNLSSKSTNCNDIQWISPNGKVASHEYWHDNQARCLGLLLAGDAGDYFDEQGLSEVDDNLLLIFNAHCDVVKFKLPEITHKTGQIGHWQCLLNTACVGQTTNKIFFANTEFELTGFSLIMLALTFN
jgi:glycogen operon protein